MNILKSIIYLYLLVLLSSGSLFAETLHLSQLEKGVAKYVLPNGMRVLFYNRGLAPIFAGVVSVRVGGVDEQLGQTGISHLLEHMAFKGTKTIGTKDYQREVPLLEMVEEIQRQRIEKKDPLLMETELQTLYEELSTIWVNNEFSQKFQEYGGVGLNATTDKELTNYFIELPRSAFEFWCWMESERLINPVMRQFYQERDVVLEERRMRYEDSPPGKLYESLLSKAFTVHPYRNPVIGYWDDLNSLTAESVDAFRKAFYVPENIVIALVGDVNPERDLPLVERYFGRLAAGKRPEHINIIEPSREKEVTLKLTLDSSPQVMVAYHKTVFPNPDDPPLSVLMHGMTNSKLSPLYKELVEKKRMAAAVNVYDAPGSAYPNLAIFSLLTKSPFRNEDLLKAFDQERKKIVHGGLSEELIENSKKAMTISFLNNLRSNISLASDLATSEALYGSWKAILDWFEQLQNVTSKDVHRVAKQYLDTTSRTVATIESKKR